MGLPNSSWGTAVSFVLPPTSTCPSAGSKESFANRPGSMETVASAHLRTSPSMAITSKVPVSNALVPASRVPFGLTAPAVPVTVQTYWTLLSSFPNRSEATAANR